MKKTLGTLSLAAVAWSGSLLLACGGGDSGADDDDTNDTPDAAVEEVDAPGLTPCTTTTVGAPAFDSGGTSSLVWTAPVESPDLGGNALVTFEFYSGIHEGLAGTWDLAANEEANYSSCALCLLVRVQDAKGAEVKTFFQSGGSLTLTEDPFTNRKMIGSVTDLALVEVTIDSEGGFTSTPVDGGTCLSIGDLTLNADAIPAGWTCEDAAYGDGATCNCACGVADPDCEAPANPVAGCSAGDVCIEAACVASCSVLAPQEGCAAGTCGYYSPTADVCHADAALVDSAALGATCTSGTFCAVTNTIATGLCDTFVGGDNVCREACDSNDDCASGEQCRAVLGEGPKGLCIAAPANDTCATATAFTIGTTVTGTTAAAASDVNTGLEPAACTGYSQAGPDVMYSLALTAGQAITVTLTPVGTDFDPSVSILGPGDASVCAANPVVCLKGADAGLGGDPETFMFTATTAGTYYLIVDAFQSGATPASGSFSLTVTSP